MPRQEKVFSVFVASPGDVQDERERLEEIIKELNLAWSRELGIRLDLLRWETHAYPGISEDPQAVINEQIPDDYDLFIGIMWSRYGTPTGRAGSGTVEEFQKAKQRYDVDQASVKIMFYFKDAPLSPSEINPEQLAQVQAFQKSLGEEGALHWKFKDIQEIEKILRLHLTRQVQEWVKCGEASKTIMSPKGGLSQKIMDSKQREDEDLGLIDLIEIFDERFKELGEIGQRLGKSTEELAERINTRTKEVQEAMEQTHGQVDRNLAKRLMERAAADMDQYVERVEAEIPLFSHNLDEGMNALIDTTKLMVEFDVSKSDGTEAQEALKAVGILSETLTSTESMISQFRTSVSSIPRMTSVLNKSKRRVTAVLDRLIEQFGIGQRLTREAEQAISNILKK
ncbi:MAG: DUF4062 domain-containing protein [Deltaproteobacteria bacterium]|nr:DUF4062 domain-containing protein [Deltaproteobacteria bacterium]